ncbi:hypothetical protein LPJ61_001588 [Coemansia biformis]|uniref:Nucleoporin Nup159/Nup146 N-terminal domain-containing protein n=1 Tax=Coemansia biformis TaxID=1286918 RepID=A0A9W7YEM0_9FUNG|nr:hypothetical protein LPJ61_001588 [Coemansia biformis]
MADSHTHELSSIELFTDKGDQLVDIVHDQIKDNVCLRVSSQRFSVARRDTPAYSRLLAVSNTYGYIVAGTPKGLSVFMTADAQDELSKGVSKGTNTAVTLSARKEIDLSAHGKVTHVGISADELSVLAATVRGSLLVFAAAALVGQGDGTPAKVIRVGQEIRDMRPNPQDAPTSVAVLTLAGDVLIVDMAQGTSKTIVPASSPRVTAICWSRKGKQIACGDTRATLTHRSPSDGSIKSTIAALATEDAIPDGAAVLAVEWMAASCFFAVYGALPGGAFTPCSGGGGEDGGSEDENDSDNTTTAAYIITRVGKTAPWEWIYVEDPCSSMICPERYPGFHTACISDWGPSAQNIVIMSGTGSDATMTIGEAATLKASDGSADPRSLDWAQWDIDGGMAVMPLSALASDGVDDAFPIGMAVDYTGRHELPPEEDGGLPVKPVPILWILNTDACLLGYHVCNTHEMRRGGRSAHMVNAVKALPGASASTIPAAASSTLEPAKTTAFASGTAFGAQKSTGASAFGASSSALSGFGKPSGTSAFGAASGFAPSFGGSSAFGKSSSIAPIVKAPTALGTPGKHVFGSGTGMGASTATTAFGMLGAAAPPAGKSIFDAPSSGPSIFDSPSSGPSIFDAPAKGSESSSFGPAKPFGSAMAATAFGSKTAGPKAAGFEASSADASTAGGNAKKSVTFGDTTVFEIPKPTAFNISTPAPEAASIFASLSSGGKLGAAAPKPLLTPTPAALKPSLTSTPAAVATQVQRAQEEQEQEQEKEKEREEAEARRRKEQEQQAAQQRELEAKAQELIDQQYVNTCNSLDRELKALAASVNRTDEAIARMRATRLPPIQVDPAVQSMAKLTSQMKDMSIDDTELWNRTADVLLEALHVSRDELRDSQRSLSRQLSMLMKTETKREEITRILGMASASASAPLASSPPHSASSDGGLNPLQRDYQRRLKSAFGLIAKRAVDVEQVVNAEADRHQSERDELPRSLRAPTLDSIQRTLNNVSKTLDQKNGELDDLVDLVNDLNLGPQSDQLRKKPRPPPLPLIAVGGTLESPGDGGRRPGEQQTGTPLTAASGVPWSPKNLLFAGPPSGKRSRGYGLHDEDVLAGGSPMTHGPAGLPYDRACQLEASPLPGEAVSAPKPAHFARTQVRELDSPQGVLGG